MVILKLFKTTLTSAAFFSGLLVFLLSACTGANSGPVYIIVTGDPSAATAHAPVGGQSTTPLPPTPAPTPTTPPDILLQLGDRYLINGYYENAAASYQAILEQGDAAPPETRAAAMFTLGQAAVREGLYSEAVTVLTEFITVFPQDARAPQAYFMRGDAYLGLSRWSEAIADFQTYLTLRPGLVDSYAYERIGDAQLALGQTDAALGSYALAIDAGRTRVPQVALRERLALRYRSVGRYAEALAQYEAILQVSENRAYRAQVELLAAQTLLDSGDSTNGYARMQRVFNDYSGTNASYEAMNVLLTAGFELDGFRVGQARYFYGDYPGAIEALTAYSTSVPLAAIPAELHMLLGRAYREVGNSAAADTSFRTVIEQYPQDALFGEALLERGRTRFLAGDIPGAIDFYLFIADNYGYLAATAAQALWRVGYLYGVGGDPVQSRTYFIRLADSYPESEEAASGLFIAASAAYNAGEFTVAEQLYARIAATTTGETQASAYMWVGRLALGRGDQARADEVFALGAAAAPESYYSVRAQDIRAGIVPFTPPVGYRFEFDDAADLAVAEAWLRTTFSITQAGDLWRMSPELDANPNMVRGRELWALGAFDQAADEFFEAINANDTNALASYQLAVYLRGIGAYYPSIFAAANVIRTAGVNTLDAPAFIARMRYPIYYLDAALAATSQYAMDPLLLFALIRHESLFNTYAVGAAAEHGLTQVIPSTAEYIAAQIGWENYQHSDLFRPYAGVEFGAFFLAEQLGRFDGNVYAALAGYNAGPGRAIDWLALSGGDPDLFMTTITIESTQLYIQSIYRNYAIYRVLYGTP